MISLIYRIKALPGINLETAIDNVRVGMSIGTLQIACGDTCQKWSAPRNKYLADFKMIEKDIFQVELDDRVIDWEHGGFTQLLSFILGDTFGRAYDVEELELIDLELSENLMMMFRACKFGLQGIRRKLNVPKRPLFALLMKPNTGMPCAYYQDLAKQAVDGGVDYLKEDELLFSPPQNNKLDRAEAIAEVIGDRPTLHGLNITEKPEHILYIYSDFISAAMLNVCYVGFDTVRTICDRAFFPIHLHRAGHDILVNNKKGMDLCVFTKLQKMTGADVIHVGTPFGNIHPPEKVKKNFDILTSWGNGKALPVISRCTLEMVDEAIDFFQSKDLMFLFDKAIYGDGKPGEITRNCELIRKKLERV